MQWPGASKLRSPIEHSQRILTLQSIGCEAKKNATYVWPEPVYFNFKGISRRIAMFMIILKKTSLYMY